MGSSPSESRTLPNIGLLFLTAAAAAVLFGFVTARHQIGLTEDCLRYLGMAKHAAAGKGFSLYNPSLGPVSLPYISQAPLWPAVIASGLAAGLRPETWMWGLVTALFGCNLILAGAAALYGTGRLSAGLAAQGLVLADTHLLTHHAYALSEPLFFLLTQTTVLTLWVYLDSGRRRWLAAAVLCAGLAGLCRYIGLTYAAVLGLAILGLGRGSWTRRLPTALAAGLAAALPLGGWLLRNLLLTGEGFGMRVAESQPNQFYPWQVTVSFVSQTLQYPIANGWLPDQPWALWVVPVLVVAAACGIKRGPVLLILFPAVYAVGMIGTWTARSVQGYPDPWRLSAPIFLHLWIFLVIGFFRIVVARIDAGQANRWSMILARSGLVLVLAWGSVRMVQTYSWFTRSAETGDYGRPDAIPWSAANRIAWFPMETGS